MPHGRAGPGWDCGTRRADDAQEFRRPLRVGQHLFNRQMQVGPVVQIEVLLDHGKIRRLRIEMLAQAAEQQRSRLPFLASLARHGTSSAKSSHWHDVEIFRILPDGEKR
jgi:hypothetical protein